MWGFASSPLVVGDRSSSPSTATSPPTTCATGNAAGRSGSRRELQFAALSTIGGVQQVLLLSETGATSVAPADGTLLWEYAWPGYPIVQPALTADGDVLISYERQ